MDSVSSHDTLHWNETNLESELSSGHEAGMLNNQVMIKKLI